MKKISLITLHAIKNYGSVLQTYATQTFFENHGFEVEVVDYIRADATNENLVNSWVENDIGVTRLLKKVVLSVTLNKWKKVFDGFLRDNIRLTPTKYLSSEDFEKNRIIADYYCVGSDQVWNSKWNKGIIPAFFLDYAPDDKPKISFASSFGKAKLEDWEIDKTKMLIQRLDSISVREESAVEIINGLGINDASHILDPTLLFDKEFWGRFASDSVVKDKYILIYQLNSNKEFDSFAKDYARKNGLKLVRLCTRYDQFFKSGNSILIPEIREFVSLFINADCIITDSFHATAFSINLNKPFISIYPGEFSTRIESILQLMKLQSRHLANYSQEIILDDIDFSYSNKILENQREQAEHFFKKAFM